MNLAGAFFFWAIGVFALCEAYNDYTTGVGHMSKSGPKHQRRANDPADFRFHLRLKVIFGIAMFIVGIVWLFIPWSDHEPRNIRY